VLIPETLLSPNCLDLLAGVHRRLARRGRGLIVVRAPKSLGGKLQTTGMEVLVVPDDESDPGVLGTG